jgi:hypothetical protein
VHSHTWCIISIIIIIIIPYTPHEYTCNAHMYLQMVRMLESSVLAWNKQIRATLSKDPESLDVTKGGDRWPSSELDFWSEHSKELHSMSTQVSLFTCIYACTQVCTPTFHDRAEIVMRIRTLHTYIHACMHA